MGKKSKSGTIIDIHVDASNAFTRDYSKYLALALYNSSKGSKHFYDVMRMLSEFYPDQYLEEFENIKQH